MDYYNRFLSRFQDYAFALHFWRHKLAVFRNGADAEKLAPEFVKYLNDLPDGHGLSDSFGQTAVVIPFTIYLRKITPADSLDNLLAEVDYQRSNSISQFLYVLADPTSILSVEYQKETKSIYRVDIGACIKLWNEMEIKKI